MILPPFTPPGPLVLHGLRSATHGPYDLCVAPGTCAVITGGSGAGKSRLLRMIADLDPHEGSAALGPQRREDMPAPAWRRQVCLVPAEPGWWADTPRAHLNDAALAESLLARLGLPPGVLDAPVSQLSTGERQRLALLRALSPALRFLLLDEPTSALDPENAERVNALLCDLKAQGLGLLVVTHHPDQARRLGDRRHVLSRDALAAQP